MTRRVSRSGRRYTAGSQATRGAYPRLCAGCGKPVVMSGLEPLWFATDAAGTRRSWHSGCRKETS